jgi:hypothetical protein
MFTNLNQLAGTAREQYICFRATQHIRLAAVQFFSEETGDCCEMIRLIHVPNFFIIVSSFSFVE